ncbi:sulfonate transport system substrate-binding protein [Streptohalobacillus salinus]|uniref:Putative aliphatic sulfonates-binding protein n=1 Tax=Streptohalobacillus salinus TaxID=621096 RepID=A0A2V3WE35_9BACI|nr:aliphatic sulfonate ABC transporter substrate-binding protein [Streptohalobacillus salinus]PXW93150.1 sulfonate transport system substrate-binding protein [Streptohalobacillus salinus]
MRKRLMVLLLSVVLITACQSAEGSDKPKEIRLDYAYYSPTSLILREFNWVEEAFSEEDIEVEWVLSQGSNKALEFLNANSIDFGSTAGAAALISKTNGSPIENVYIYSKPEWTALVTNENSEITTVDDLVGKKIAATIGTDPYIFLLRTLDAHGIDESEVEIINLQHHDGALALSEGQVDAWAGLDPHMARLELEEGAKLFFREPDYNTFGFLNARTEFIEQYPDYTERVIKLYEKARKWAIEHPDEAAEIVSKHAGIDLDVAKQQLTRNDFSEPIPSDTHKTQLIEAGEILKRGGVIDSEHEIETFVEALIEPRFSEKVIAE